MKIYQLLFFFFILASCSTKNGPKAISEDQNNQTNKYMINDTLCDCSSLDIDRDNNIIKLFNEEKAYTGWCVFFVKNGILREKRQFKDGKLNGDFITYYENGSIESFIPHRNNRYNGLYYKLNESGDTTYQRLYKNGVAVN